MDVIKTRQQGFFHEATVANGNAAHSLQNIRWQKSAKVIYKERGILGFWDGLVAI